jgi:hypothetical protein
VNHTTKDSAKAVQEVVGDTIRQGRIPAKVIAGRMAMEVWKLYQIGEGNARRLRAEEVAAFVRAAEDTEVLDVICRDAGGVFVMLPSVGASTADDVAHVSKVVTEFGQGMQEVGGALADGRLTPEEFARVKAEWLETIAAAHSLILHLEARVTR